MKLQVEKERVLLGSDSVFETAYLRDTIGLKRISGAGKFLDETTENIFEVKKQISNASFGIVLFISGYLVGLFTTLLFT
jgi:hypothetical protein